MATRGRSPAKQTARAEVTALAVVLFEDMQASTALKRAVTRRADEAAFQDLRKEHDAVVKGIVERHGAGRVVKWTGDGVIALFTAPSVAVERAIEIQEAMHAHPQIKVRIGIDLGEVRVESERGRPVDVFGVHVDTAARAMSLVDGGHVAVTTPVYRDAFSWITKSRIAWKRHGRYRAKPGDEPFEVHQPYNANHHRPMRQLRGERAEEDQPRKTTPTKAPVVEAPPAADDVSRDVELIRPWEAVARDGNEFATNGAGTMYWFKVPLGGLSYPEGFRHFLQPALENDRIGKIRFVLDATNPTVMSIWAGLVLPLLRKWADGGAPGYEVEEESDRGALRFAGSDGRPKSLGWVFVDLSLEFTPCFKLFVDDPDREQVAEQTAQIFLSTANRMARLADGTNHSIRIPDAVLRVHAGHHEALLHALNAVANQWDSLFW
jgi:class 3 adenylate cyclase